MSFYARGGKVHTKDITTRDNTFAISVLTAAIASATRLLPLLPNIDSTQYTNQPRLVLLLLLLLHTGNQDCAYYHDETMLVTTEINDE